MTIHHLHAVRPDGQPPEPHPSEPQPARRGQPWTTDDHETLVARCRDGASASELAEALERTESAVVVRAKRLLPVDQRGAPQDHVIPHLRRLLQEDADYDWGKHLAATPAPRPIVNYLPAPQVRHGIPGLVDDELLALAGLMIRWGEDRIPEVLRSQVAAEVRARHLSQELSIRVTDEVDAWVEVFLRGQPASYHYRDDGWDPPPPYDEPYDIGPAREPESSGQWAEEEPPW